MSIKQLRPQASSCGQEDKKLARTGPCDDFPFASDIDGTIARARRLFFA
jgi:hypothetical protein